MNKLLS